MAAGSLKADLSAVYYAVSHMRDAGLIEPRARGGGNVLIITDAGRRAVVRIENHAICNGRN
jgi:DNA-binding PadR family transcriptional regulator